MGATTSCAQNLKTEKTANDQNLLLITRICFEKVFALWEFLFRYGAMPWNLVMHMFNLAEKSRGINQMQDDPCENVASHNDGIIHIVANNKQLELLEGNKSQSLSVCLTCNTKCCNCMAWVHTCWLHSDEEF
eukprot:5307126-Amphidinium_carterae.1